LHTSLIVGEEPTRHDQKDVDRSACFRVGAADMSAKGRSTRNTANGARRWPGL